MKLDLVQGYSVEYKPDGASQSTFFDLERGKLDEQYQHFLQRAGWLRCTLRMWTRPHGHTGTARLVASGVGTGPVQLSASGILGDIRALAQLDCRMGSGAANTQPTTLVFAYGVHPHPSYLAVRGASLIGGQSGATIVGGSGAFASQYVTKLVTATNTNAVQVAWLGLGDPRVYTGRHRVLLIGRTSIWPATGISLQTQRVADGLLGPTTLFPKTSASQWSVLDLGEISAPGIGSAAAATDMCSFNVISQGASGASAVASPALHINAIVLLPLDYGAVGVITQYQPSSGTNQNGNRQRIELDSWPVRMAAYSKTGATDFAFGLTAALKGDFPYLPPSPSGASGAAQVVVLAGDPNDFLGNDNVNVAVRAVERFSFFR